MVIPEWYKSIASEYKNGASSVEVGKKFGYTPIHVLRIVRLCGVRVRTQSESKLGKPSKKRLFSDEREKTLCEEYRSGKTIKEIAEPLGVAIAVLARILKRNGVKSRISYDTGKVGKYASRWRGGRTKNETGHVRIPSRNASKFEYEHRAIMQKHLGRKLESWEVVHHKNGIPDDNRIRNLQVMSKREHQKLHAKEQGLGTKIKGGRKWH
jgi:hypothetical protein